LDVVVLAGVATGLTRVRAISLALSFFGFNRPDAKVSQGTIDWFWLAGMRVSIKRAYDCVR
jgi:hypothetical protein